MKKRNSKRSKRSSKCSKRSYKRSSKRSKRSKRSSKRSIRNTIGFREYMHNGMVNKSFRSIPKKRKIQIIKEAIKVSKHKGAKKRMRSDLKHLQNSFGYSHEQGPQVFNTYMSDGMLLADNAFSWQGNVEARAENA